MVPWRAPAAWQMQQINLYIYLTRRMHHRQGWMKGVWKLFGGARQVASLSPRIRHLPRQDARASLSETILFSFLFFSFWQMSCSPRQLNLDDERALFSLSSAVHNGRTFHSLTVCIYHVLRFNLTAANSVGKKKQTKHTSDTKESHVYVGHAIGAIDRRLLWNKNVHIFSRLLSKAFMKCCK